jgi:hypothetical protein
MESCLGVAQSETGAGQVPVGCGEPGIDLDGIAELDHRLLVLSALIVLVAASQVRTLFFVRVAGTATQQQHDNETNQMQPIDSKCFEHNQNRPHIQSRILIILCCQFLL